MIKVRKGRTDRFPPAVVYFSTHIKFPVTWSQYIPLPGLNNSSSRTFILLPSQKKTPSASSALHDDDEGNPKLAVPGSIVSLCVFVPPPLQIEPISFIYWYYPSKCVVTAKICYHNSKIPQSRRPTILRGTVIPFTAAYIKLLLPRQTSGW